MTITVTEIFNGNLNPLSVETSSVFTDGLFFIFQIDEPDDIGYDFGIALVVQFNTGSSIQTKDVPIRFQSENVTSTFNTASIPAEYRQAGFEMFLGFNSSIPINNLRCWLVSSNATLDTIDDDLTAIQEQLQQIADVQAEQLALEIAQAVNAVAQSFTLLTFATAFAPLTIGGTTPAIPALTAGINTLIGIGLPLLP